MAREVRMSHDIPGTRLFDGDQAQKGVGGISGRSSQRGEVRMARIIGGIGTTHVPSIGKAIAEKKQNDPCWKPFFSGFDYVHRWLARERPPRAEHLGDRHLRGPVEHHAERPALFVCDEQHHGTFKVGIAKGRRRDQ